MKEEKFVAKVLDPDYPYAKQVKNILTHAKNKDGERFFSEDLLEEDITNERANELLPLIINAIYKDSEKKPPKLISSESRNNLRRNFFAQLYGDLTEKLSTEPIINATIEPSCIKAVEKLTMDGLKTLVHFFNISHPEVEETHHATFALTRDIEKNTDNSRLELEELSKIAGNHKLILTIKSIDREGIERPEHSMPIFLSDDNLILLRDEVEVVENTLKLAAEKIGKTFIPAVTFKEGEKRTSVQGGLIGCHMFAALLLGDKPAKYFSDMIQEDGSIKLTAEAVKFSESGTHINKMLAGEELSKEREEALSFLKEHKRKDDDGSFVTALKTTYKNHTKLMRDTANILCEKDSYENVAKQMLSMQRATVPGASPSSSGGFETSQLSASAGAGHSMSG